MWQDESRGGDGEQGGGGRQERMHGKDFADMVESEERIKSDLN